MPQLTLGKLRAIKLPAPKDDEADHLTAIRRAVAAHEAYPDSHKLGVPDVVADLCPDDKPEQPKPNKDATLKS
jgi:hypothetical protein